MPDSYPCETVEYLDGGFCDRTVQVVGEVPLRIMLNGRDVVTLLCTGNNPELLAVGFCKSDALLTDPGQIKDVSTEYAEECIKVRIRTADDPWLERVDERTVTSGCGKGTNFGRNVRTVSKRRLGPGPTITPRQILERMADLKARAQLHARTRGCHNASLCTPEQTLIFHEDIGRHNAIDMIVGHCFLEGIDTRDKLIVCTGRVASEILLKVARLGVPVICSTASATSMAAGLARTVGLTLIGNVHADGLRVYNHGGRISGL
ncbi:MAG: formate dehydrogenase accessory sulfurtransferase FdhD [Desulfovibrionaceae bacterium]|nr:formate dehydrogenase accessory sulfurtransferase FdhD [Desulfovibrionaceae bacterium]